MKAVDVRDAGTDLDRWIQEVLDGEQIVIARAGDPLVRLVAIDRPRRHKSLGWAKGQVVMSPDFDAPLDLVVGSEDDA